jgi:hypothetical protein
VNYQQHRNHLNDGTYPWPGCYWCQQFIVQPAIREMRNHYPRLTGRVFTDLDGIDLDELAAEEAAA